MDQLHIQVPKEYVPSPSPILHDMMKEMENLYELEATVPEAYVGQVLDQIANLECVIEQQIWHETKEGKEPLKWLRG